MKQNLLIPVFILSLLFLAAGCQPEELEQPVFGTSVLTAFTENSPATKTQWGQTDDSHYFAFWSESDSLAVYVDGESTADKYALLSGAGSGKATFSGTKSGSRYVALYPYRDLVPDGLQGDVLTLTLPAEQTYAPDSFGEGAFPMLAIGGGPELSFKNLCAILKISLTGAEPVREIRFVAHDTTKVVSGRASVRTDFDAAPELVMAEGGSPRVTLKCGGVQLSEDVPTAFFLVVPAGVYPGGFSIEVETASGLFVRHVDASVGFGRSQYRDIDPFRVEAGSEINSDSVPQNEIWYVTYNDEPIEVNPACFDRNVLSHTYADGRGVIVFDGPVTRVGNENYECVFGEGVTELHLPDCVEWVGPNAFENSWMATFRAPDKLQAVGSNAFRNNRLNRLYGKSATADKRALVVDGAMVAYALGSLGEDLVIPEGVTSVAPYLFWARQEIRNVILPDSMLSLGDMCFFTCQNLETVTFPAQFASLGVGVFENCSLLREFKGDCPFVRDGRMFITPDGKLVAFAGNGAMECVVPEGVTTIMGDIFKNNKTLKSLTLPSSVDNYYTDWLYGCDQLEAFYGPWASEDHHCLILYGNYLVGVTPVLPVDYTLPEGISHTFFRVFAGNTTTQRLTLPDDMAFLGDGAFEDMRELRTIQLSTRLSNLGRNAFAGDAKLDSILFRSYTPPAYEEDVFFGHEGLTMLVPEGTESIYKESGYWSQYASYFKGHHYDDLTPPDYYISEDYSQDGVVTALQTASAGRGIDLVLMGDAFSDRQIADGTYASVMNKMADAFFSEEPYTTCRNLFNVYAVNVVSATEGYEHGGQTLGSWVGAITQVGGSDVRCMEYARKAVSEDRMENTLIIVAMNASSYGGTCYMYDPVSTDCDYGCGTSVAYFTVGMNDEDLAQLVRHEAGGHGFAKLADEYAYENMGAIPQSEIGPYHEKEPYGWWKNVDFTNDPETVKWSYFLKDSRYQYDGLGIFEGACTYWKGAYRPTENSIMRHNTGGYNAPSREAIWYRLHKLAYGDAWTYDYEDFVAYDAMNRKTAASSAGAWSPSRQTAARPTHPPVVVSKTWREAMAESHATERSN